VSYLSDAFDAVFSGPAPWSPFGVPIGGAQAQPIGDFAPPSPTTTDDQTLPLVGGDAAQGGADRIARYPDGTPILDSTGNPMRMPPQRDLGFAVMRGQGLANQDLPSRLSQLATWLHGGGDMDYQAPPGRPSSTSYKSDPTYQDVANYVYGAMMGAAWIASVDLPQLQRKTTGTEHHLMDSPEPNAADRDDGPPWLTAGRIASVLYGVYLLASAVWWAIGLQYDILRTAALALPIILLWIARRRFAMAFALWCMTTVAVWGLNSADPSGYFQILWAALPLVPLWIGFVGVAILVAIGRWRRGARWGAALAGLVPLLAVAAIFAGVDIADEIHFRLVRADYVAAIAAARAGHPMPDTRIEIGPPAFAYFRWGGVIFGSSGVAYDETDETGKPVAERSEAWRKRRQHSELACGADVRRLGGHFYMVHADC
jgi:hypothetical protein